MLCSLQQCPNRMKTYGAIIEIMNNITPTNHMKKVKRKIYSSSAKTVQRPNFFSSTMAKTKQRPNFFSSPYTKTKQCPNFFYAYGEDEKEDPNFCLRLRRI